MSFPKSRKFHTRDIYNRHGQSHIDAYYDTSYVGDDGD